MNEGDTTAQLAASIDTARAVEGGQNRTVIAGCAGQIVVALAASAVAFGLLGSLGSTAQTVAFLVLLVIGQFVATLLVTASVVKVRGLGLILALLPLLFFGSVAAFVGSEGESFEDQAPLIALALWIVAIGVTAAGYAVGRRWRWRTPAEPGPQAMAAAEARLARRSFDWQMPSFTVRYDDTGAGHLEMELDRRLADAHGFRVIEAEEPRPRRTIPLIVTILSLALAVLSWLTTWGSDDPRIEVTYTRRSRA